MPPFNESVLNQKHLQFGDEKTPVFFFVFFRPLLTKFWYLISDYSICSSHDRKVLKRLVTFRPPLIISISN